jgi:hypothetical protein
MTHTDAPTARPATVRIITDGMSIFRYSVATGELLGSMIYSEWDGTYVAYRNGEFVRRTEGRGFAMRAMLLGY